METRTLFFTIYVFTLVALVVARDAVPPIELNPCKDYCAFGNCDLITEQGTKYPNCTCNKGFEGVKCDKPKEESCYGVRCKQGFCNDNNTKAHCVCPAGYFGHRCQFMECDIPYCGQNDTYCIYGDCLMRGDNKTCACDVGYSGIHCETFISHCANFSCLNETCIDDQTSFKAYHCQFNTSENKRPCDSSPCLDGDICLDEIIQVRHCENATDDGEICVDEITKAYRCENESSLEVGTTRVCGFCRDWETCQRSSRDEYSCVNRSYSSNDLSLSSSSSVDIDIPSTKDQTLSPSSSSYEPVINPTGLFQNNDESSSSPDKNDINPTGLDQGNGGFSSSLEDTVPNPTSVHQNSDGSSSSFSPDENGTNASVHQHSDESSSSLEDTVTNPTRVDQNNDGSTSSLDRNVINPTGVDQDYDGSSSSSDRNVINPTGVHQNNDGSSSSSDRNVINPTGVDQNNDGSSSSSDKNVINPTGVDQDNDGSSTSSDRNVINPTGVDQDNDGSSSSSDRNVINPTGVDQDNGESSSSSDKNVINPTGVDQDNGESSSSSEKNVINPTGVDQDYDGSSSSSDRNVINPTGVNQGNGESSSSSDRNVINPTGVDQDNGESSSSSDKNVINPTGVDQDNGESFSSSEKNVINPTGVDQDYDGSSSSSDKNVINPTGVDQNNDGSSSSSDRNVINPTGVDQDNDGSSSSSDKNVINPTGVDQDYDESFSSSDKNVINPTGVHQNNGESSLSSDKNVINPTGVDQNNDGSSSSSDKNVINPTGVDQDNDGSSTSSDRNVINPTGVDQDNDGSSSSSDRNVINPTGVDQDNGESSSSSDRNVINPTGVDQNNDGSSSSALSDGNGINPTGGIQNNDGPSSFFSPDENGINSSVDQSDNESLSSSSTDEPRIKPTDWEGSQYISAFTTLSDETKIKPSNEVESNPNLSPPSASISPYTESMDRQTESQRDIQVIDSDHNSSLTSSSLASSSSAQGITNPSETETTPPPNIQPTESSTTTTTEPTHAGTKGVVCSEDGLWPETGGDNVATVPCSTGTGNMERFCMKTGEWGTITRSKCVSQDVAAAEAELSKLMIGNINPEDTAATEEAISVIANIGTMMEKSVERMTSNPAAETNTGDAKKSVEIAKNITDFGQNLIMSLNNDEEKENVAKTVMGPLEKAKKATDTAVNTEADISDEDKREAIRSKLDIIDAIESFATVVADVFLHENSTIDLVLITSPDGNMKMLCVKRKDTELNVTVGTVGVDLPRKGKQGQIVDALNAKKVQSVKIVFVESDGDDHKSAEGLQRIKQKGSTFLGGGELSMVEVERKNGEIVIIEKFQMTFTESTEKFETLSQERFVPKCVYLRTDTVGLDPVKQYSETGCEKPKTEFQGEECKITCVCNHMTNFAILMQVEEVPISKSDETALELISNIGLSISIICLAASLIVLLILRKLKSERVFVLKNLIVVLMLAQLLFVTAVEHASFDNDFCLAITIILHYSFTAVFFWMLNMGLNLVFLTQLKPKMENARIPLYCILGYGIPAIITAVAAGVKHKLYGNDEYCWLTTEDGVIYAFVGPALTIIAVNLGVLIYVVTRYFSLKRNLDDQKRNAARVGGDPDRIYKYRKDKILAAKTMVALRGGLVLTPLLGFTWIFGVLSFSESTIAFQYLFNILNCLQGVAILVFAIILNKEVRKAWKKQFSGGKVETDSTTELTSTPSPEGSTSILVPSPEPKYKDM